jgi:hypothetical protein
MKKIFIIISLVVLSFANDVVIDKNTKLMWQDTKDINQDNIIDAVSYCNKLSLNSFDDWRLPSVEELISIVDDTKYNSSIENKFKNTKSNYYWSNTNYVNTKSDKWIVSFKDGHSKGSAWSNSYYVRCVRDIK